MSLRADAVSTVVRLHDPARLDNLSSALLSLAAQEYPSVEPIVVLQRFSVEAEQKVRDLVAGIAWPATFLKPLVSNATTPEGDHRARLANEGIEVRRGRFLAFLDFDDRIDPRCYSTLVGALQRSGAALAFCGVTLVRAERGKDGVTVIYKRPIYLGRTKYDVFVQNHHPIHSFVIDTDRVRPELLHFDPTMTRGEDYAFLLRLLSECDWDISAGDMPLCEYFQWTDRAYTFEKMSDADRLAWAKADGEVEAVRRQLRVTLSASDLREIIQAAPLAARVAKHEMQRPAGFRLGVLEPTASWAVDAIVPDASGRRVVRGWMADRRGRPATLVYIYRRRLGVLTLAGMGPGDVARPDVAAHLGVSHQDHLYGFEIVCRLPEGVTASELVLGGVGPSGPIVAKRGALLTRFSRRRT